MSLPSTIYNQDGFLSSPSAGFDGVFDWSWTQGCFGETRISPMDFDGVVERNGNFLLFETKKKGVSIPEGQRITLDRAHRLGCFTVMIIHGKERPEETEVWYPTGKKETLFGLEKTREKVSSWYAWANKNKTEKVVDVSLLNRRIESISQEKELLETAINEAVSILTKALMRGVA